MTEQEQLQSLLRLLMSAGGGLGSFQGLSNPALSQLKTLGPTGKGGLPSYDEVPAGQYNPKPDATPPPYKGRPVFGKPTPEDELRHKTLDRYLNDPKVNLDDPKVVDLLRVLGLTNAEGGMFPVNADLMGYFRGKKKSPPTIFDPPIDEANPVPGYTEIPKGAIPVGRGAFMYEADEDQPPKNRKNLNQREYQRAEGYDLDERMRNRILNDYFNGLLKLPDPMQDEEPSMGNAPISMYFQPIAQLIRTLANGGQT